MGDGDHGAWIILQEALQPGHRFGVEVIGRFVKQQHVRLGQQQAAQGDAAFFATGQLGHVCIPGRQAQGVGGDIQGAVEIMAVGGVQIGFEVGLFGGQLVEIGLGIGIGGVDFVEPRQGVFDRRDRFLDVAAHVLAGVELWLLRQEADMDAGLRTGLAENIGIDAGHDAQQGGFARAVQTEYANLGAGEERQGNILEDLALGRDNLAHAVHGVDVLGHRFCSRVVDMFGRPIYPLAAMR